ncbi:phage tail protein [Paenibacillus tundrae]|uniref:Uncharacterized protein n=1 Tax=Paenibacillus tundrae TaxID=528187 RepID=A0ABT9W6S1_9BACL|nr:phage tail protein [Paenibacillus tundrae]MDQ0168782.1 hypothetical protein [Paenibacillus tundrae]
MAQLPMYAAAVNSPGTELAADITATDTEITLLDASKLPTAPNLVTVGGDETAETILYTGKTGNTLTGCTRGFEGTAKGWAAGSLAARNHTAYDYEAGRANIADLDERVDNIVIPDASLTEKGIVQLSDATDGARSNVAATEKAVKDAREAAIRDAGIEVDKTYIRKNRPSNLLPNSSAELGTLGWTNVNTSIPFVPSNDIDDEVSTSFVSNGSTTSASSIFRSDNMTIRNGVTYTLSADFMNPAGVAGQINVSLKTAAGVVAGSITCDAGTAWHRKAITFPTGVGTYYVELSIPLGLTGSNRRVRRIMLSTGTDGELWNQDSNDRLLFQSVSDGKTAVAAAITGKGVAASGSDTFPHLATKIEQISTGPKYATGTVTANSSPSAFTTQQGGTINLPWVAVTGLGFRPNRIIIRVSGTTTNLGMTVYNYETRNAAPTEPAAGYNIATVITADQGSGYNIRVYERLGSNSSLACVNGSQFFMPVSGNGSGGLSYTWEAFQV